MMVKDRITLSRARILLGRCYRISRCRYALRPILTSLQGSHKAVVLVKACPFIRAIGHESLQILGLH